VTQGECYTCFYVHQVLHDVVFEHVALVLANVRRQRSGSFVFVEFHLLASGGRETEQVHLKEQVHEAHAALGREWAAETDRRVGGMHET
jgi:hypothetical protein